MHTHVNTIFAGMKSFIIIFLEHLKIVAGVIEIYKTTEKKYTGKQYLLNSKDSLYIV